MRRIYFLAFIIVYSIVAFPNAQTIEDKDLCVAGNGQENALACTRYGRVLFQDKSNPARTSLMIGPDEIAPIDIVEHIFGLMPSLSAALLRD